MSKPSDDSIFSHDAVGGPFVPGASMPRARHEWRREVITHTLFDTVRFVEDRNYCNAFRYSNTLGDLNLTNLDMPGQLAGDATFKTRDIVFGGAAGTLREWEDIRWTFEVGASPQLDGRLWFPPDAVERSVDQPEVLRTPTGWDFLVFTPSTPIHVAARQNFRVILTALSGQPPRGSIRVLLRGDLTRDFLE